MMVPRLHPSPTEELMSARRIIGLTLVTLGMVILLWGGVFWTDRDTIVNTGAVELQTKERRVDPEPPPRNFIAGSSRGRDRARGSRLNRVGSAGFQDLVDQEQVGEQRAHVNRRIQIVDEL